MRVISLGTDDNKEPFVKHTIIQDPDESLIANTEINSRLEESLISLLFRY
jgi:hypothetical protein